MKKYIKYILVLVAAGIIQANSLAQDSLSFYLQQAALNNPVVKAIYLEFSAAMEKVPQAGSLPDPQVSFGYFVKPMQLLGGNQVADIQLMQMFPWFGTLKAGRDEASMMAKARYEAFNSSKAQLFYDVKSSWYRLMKYDREIALVNENLEVLESIEKLAVLKFQSPGTDESGEAMQGTGSMPGSSPAGTMNSAGNSMGGMTQQDGASINNPESTSSASMSSVMRTSAAGLQDILRVKMEILEQKNKIELLSDQRKTEEFAFNALLNRSPEIPVQISDSLVLMPLPAERFAIADSILNNNPMLAMLVNENDRYLYMEQKARKMGLPMVGAGLNYMVIQERSGNSSMMNGKDMLMPMVSVTIPLYRKKYNAMQNESRLMREAGNQKIIDFKNDLMVQYRQFIQNIDDAERRIALYSEQKELARRTTELLLSDFSTTGTGYEEVLRMQLKVLDYSFKHTEAVVDYNTAVAMAEMLINSINF